MTTILAVIATVVLAVMVATARNRTWLKIAGVVVFGVLVVEALSWLARPHGPQPAQYSGQSESYAGSENGGTVGQNASPDFDPGAPGPGDASRPVPGTPVNAPDVIESDACTSFGAQLHLPADTRVMAVAASGGRKTGFQIDAGAEATQIEVAVNSPDHPVVLMVSGSGPTIWNIGLTANSRVLAVLASGKGRQAIASLDRGLPVLSSTREDDLSCAFFMIERADVQSVNPVALRVFRRPVDRVYLGSGGSVVVGDPLPYGAALAKSADTAPETFRDKSLPLAGETGLDDSVRKGLLRAATDADFQAWANLRTDSTSEIGGHSIDSLRYHAYVVTGPFTFPAGLYGGNSATFLVPAGVPMPKGDGGHSTVLAFDNRECAIPMRSVICPSSKGE